MHSLSVEYHIKTADRLYLIYIHLIFSQVENLQDFKELGEQRGSIKPISKDIETVNVMNADCLFANLKNVDLDNLEKSKGLGVSNFGVEVILEKNICRSNKDRLILSLNYLDKAIQSHG